MRKKEKYVERRSKVSPKSAGYEKNWRNEKSAIQVGEIRLQGIQRVRQGTVTVL